jgi:transcriptional regulator with XRE-family HTH domain
VALCGDNDLGMMNTDAAGVRLTDARLRAGLTVEAAAERAGIPIAWYRDLENDPDELFSNIALAHLQGIGIALGVSPAEFLVGHPLAVSPAEELGFAELVERLEARRIQAGLSADEFSEHVGWELQDVLIDPQGLWNFTVDGLRDVCAAAGVDWLTVLPNLDADPPHHEPAA